MSFKMIFWSIWFCVLRIPKNENASQPSTISSWSALAKEILEVQTKPSLQSLDQECEEFLIPNCMLWSVLNTKRSDRIKTFQMKWILLTISAKLSNIDLMKPNALVNDAEQDRGAVQLRQLALVQMGVTFLLLGPK